MRPACAAVRAAIGPQPQLRLDANGAWSVDEAERVLSVLSRYGLELVEEPVSGLAATAALRARVPVRIAIDETAASPGALTARVADAVCLKISRCGGIGGLLAAASAGPLDRRRGLPRVDLRWSPSASPRPCTPPLRWRRCRACGLATLGLFDGPSAASRASTARSRSRARPGSASSVGPARRRSRQAPRVRGDVRPSALPAASHRRSRPRACGRRRHRRCRAHRQESPTGIESSPSRAHIGAIAPGPSAAKARARAAGAQRRSSMRDLLA